MAWFGLFVLGLLFWSVDSAGPRQLTTVYEAVDLLKSGGLISYALDHTKCTLNIPRQLPAHSWGTRITDVIISGDGQGNLSVDFSVGRPITGKLHRNPEGSIRFTEVTLSRWDVLLNVTDIDKHTFETLVTGTLECGYNENGIKLYEQAVGGEEILTQSDLISMLKRGFSINYVVDLDRCNEPRSDGRRQFWSGKIQDYRLGLDGGLESTHSFDTPQRTYYLIYKVTVDNQVRVKTSHADRLTRVLSPEEIGWCDLGDGFRVFRSLSNV